MEGSENKISFIKDVAITSWKTDAIYSELSNEIEKCGGIWIGNDGASVITGHKKSCLKIKKG